MEDEKVRLAPDAWIEAGLLALVQGGIEAVRVETLAKSLGVTKGSFYWHFKDRRALLNEMLSGWEHKATLSVIEQVGARGGTASQRLRTLIELCTSGRADGLEGAVRAWGSADAIAQQTLVRVDRSRERFVVELFRELGLAKDGSAKRARILYLALIGELTWTSHGGKASGRAVWIELFELLVTMS